MKFVMYRNDAWPCWLYWVTYHGKVQALDITTGYVLDSSGHDEKGKLLSDAELVERLKYPPYKEIILEF